MGFDDNNDEPGDIFDAFENPGNGADSDTADFAPQGQDNQEGIVSNPYDDADDDSGELVSPPDEAEPLSYDSVPGKTERVEPFAPSKAPASAILGKGPRKLNKTLILYALFGTLSVLVIFALFVSPLMGKKKAEKTKKPSASLVAPMDYSALVPRKSRETPEAAVEQEDDDAIIEGLPPVNPEYRYAPPEAKQIETVVVAGGGSGSSRPDTRGDRLQGKSIAGIKGVTPTQSRYLGAGGALNQPFEQAPVSDNPYERFGMPSKEEYAAQTLSAYASSASSPGSAYQSQNDQSGKQNFYSAGRENAGNGSWLGPATIWQGTVFEAVLSSAVNTDLPGEVAAIISKNVYSSLDGRYLLIPQNSKLYGSYNSSISYSQSRVQVGWHTLIRPDGYAVSLGNMAAADAQGAAGLKGFVNDHPFQYLKALALMSVVNIVNAEFENSAADTDNQYVQNIMADSRNVTTTLGAKLIDRAMDAQPTITIKAGVKINIVAHTTLALPPLPPYDVTMPYRR
jgi:type IV secretion system protein VirB10